MPLDVPTQTDGLPLLLTPPERRESPSFGETMGAAFRRENTVASLVENLKRPDVPKIGQTFGFDQFDEIEGTIFEHYPESLIGVRTPWEKERVRQKLQREVGDLETLHSAGAMGMLATLTAGFLDPIVLIPFGTATRAAKVARGIVSANALKGGALAARATALGASATELVLHSEQDTRTWGESVLNVTGATVLGGILGSGITRISGELRARAIRDVERDFGVVAGGSERAGSESLTIRPQDMLDDAADGGSRSEIRVKNAFGLEKALSFLHTSPMLRLMVKSRSQEAKRIIMEMADQGFIVEGFEGGRSVESNILAWDAVRGNLTSEGDRLFTLYRQRVTGSKPGGRGRRFLIEMQDRVTGKDAVVLSKKEFLEAAGKSGRIGDIAGISPQGRAIIPPEAAELAQLHRKLVYDPIAKEFVDLGLLPEEILEKGPSYAASYMRRLYNRQKIMMELDAEGGQVFKNKIKFWLHQKLEPDEIDAITKKNPGLSHAEAIELELERAADDITGNVTGEGMGRVVYGKQSFGSPDTLKQRALDFDDEFIMDFLENDIDVLTQGYMRTTVPDVELRKRFDSVEMVKQTDAVKKEYRNILKGVTDKKQRQKIIDQQKDDEMVLGAIRERLRGTFAIPDEKWGKLITVGRVARTLNMTAQGGSFLISSLADVAMPVLRHGLIRTMRTTMTPLAHGLRPLKLASAEVRKAAAGWELVLDTRMRAMADIGDEVGRNKVEHIAKSVASNFSLVNILSPWNSVMKQWAGVVGQTRLIDVIDAISRGKHVRAGDLEDLAQIRLGDDMVRRIGAELQGQNGMMKKGGISWGNTDTWADSEAVLAFRSAIRQMVDNTIITPGVGDRPLFMSTEIGKTMFQYKSFALASTQRLLLTSLQKRDLATMNGMMIAVGVGAFVETFKTWNAGRELPQENTAAYLVGAGIDRSGMIGVIGDGFNFADKLGFGFMPGGPLSSRYAARNAASSLMGPTMGLTETGFRLASASREGFAEGDVRALRRMVPYQNLFYFRKLLDQVEREFNESIGIPMRKKR